MSEGFHAIISLREFSQERQCPSFAVCEGNVNQYQYMPDLKWRPLFRCDYHGAELGEGWVKV